MIYRKDIDGLRAIAVLSVVFYHLGYGWISGGFLGVDVFFVISGFLITGIIIDELKAGTFSFVNFYERRIRRILPALYLVSFLCMPFVYLWFFQSELRDFFQSILAIPLFLTNVLFYTEIDYFNPDPSLKPLLHTWSLAVEEQFYVIMPILMFVIYRLFKVKVLITTISIIFITSIVYTYHMLSVNPNFAFYMLPTRMWELLMGSLGAFYIRSDFYKIHINKNKLNNTLSIIGIIFIVFALFSYDKNNSIHLLYLIIATVGTLLLLVNNKNDTTIGRILRGGVITLIGKISYSLYLFHQPIIVFANYKTFNQINNFDKIILLIVMFVLSYLSWKYVENYFRDKKKITRKNIFKLSGVLAIICFVLFGLSDYYEGFKNRTVGKSNVSYNFDFDYGLGERCSEFATDIDECKTGKNPKVLLFGDSVGINMGSVLKHSKTKIPFEQITAKGCLPLLTGQYAGKARLFYDDCEQKRPEVFKYIENSDHDIIVLSSIFAFYSNIEWIKLYDKKVSKINDQQIIQIFIDTIKRFEKQGKKVVIIAQPPTTGTDLSMCYQAFVRTGKKQNEICSFTEKDYDIASLKRNQFLKQVEKYAPVLWLQNYICDNGTCQNMIKYNNVYNTVYSDEMHFSKPFSKYLGEKFDIMGEVIKLSNQ